MSGRIIDLKDFKPPDLPKFSPQWIRLIAAAVLGLVVLVNTFYQIQPEEVGVVLRFGKYVRTTEPGLRTKLPLLERVLKVPVQRQLKQEFGFRTIEAAQRSRYATDRLQGESMMLTGDLNVAVVEWIVQYRVADPFRYLFRVRNVDETFRYMNEATMREAVGDRTVTEVLTVGRQEIESVVHVKLQELVNQYEMGVTVDQIVLQDVTPPEPVKPSWDEVNQAQQQQDRLVNEAQAEYNKIIPRAAGEAQQTILEAEGYALNRVNRARGDASRFVALYQEYRRAPEVTRRRLHLEAMQTILPQTGQRLLLDEDAKGVLPLLSLDGAKLAVPQQQTGGAR